MAEAEAEAEVEPEAEAEAEAEVVPSLRFQLHRRYSLNCNHNATMPTQRYRRLDSEH